MCRPKFDCVCIISAMLARRLARHKQKKANYSNIKQKNVLAISIAEPHKVCVLCYSFDLCDFMLDVWSPSLLSCYRALDRELKVLH